MARSLAWIDAGGTEWPFTSSNSDAEWPLKGHLGAVWSFVEKAFSGDDGASTVDIKAGLRDFTFPFSVYADSELLLDVLLDEWIGVLTPDVGDQPTMVRSTRTDGSTRDFVCRYKTGFDQAQESPGTGRIANAQLSTALTFRGGPFWLETIAQSQDFSPDNLPGLWLPVSFPYYLSGSSIFDRRSVFNTGHRRAWPVWTIRGPGSSVKLVNESTGKWISLDYGIDENEEIVIDAREPGNRTIVSSTRGNVMAYCTGAPWPLERNENIISVDFAAATSQSAVRLEFQRRFNNP